MGIWSLHGFLVAFQPSPNRLQLVQTRPKMQPCIRAYLLTSLCIISMTISIFVEYLCTAIFVPYFARILFLYLYTGCKMKDRAIFVQVVNLAMEGRPDAKSRELLPNHWVFWFTIDDILRMVNWNHWYNYMPQQQEGNVTSSDIIAIGLLVYNR